MGLFDMGNDTNKDVFKGQATVVSWGMTGLAHLLNAAINAIPSGKDAKQTVAGDPEIGQEKGNGTPDGTDKENERQRNLPNRGGHVPSGRLEDLIREASAQGVEITPTTDIAPDMDQTLQNLKISTVLDHYGSFMDKRFLLEAAQLPDHEWQTKLAAAIANSNKEQFIARSLQEGKTPSKDDIKKYYESAYEIAKKDVKKAGEQIDKEFREIYDKGKGELPGGRMDVAFFGCSYYDKKKIKKILREFAKEDQNRDNTLARETHGEPGTLEGKAAYEIKGLTKEQADRFARLLAREGFLSERSTAMDGSTTVAIPESVMRTEENRDEVSKALGLAIAAGTDKEELLSASAAAQRQATAEALGRAREDGADVTLYDTADPSHRFRMYDGKTEEWRGDEKIRESEGMEAEADMCRGMVSPAAMDTAEFDKKGDAELGLPWTEVCFPLAKEQGKADREVGQAIEGSNPEVLDHAMCLKIERREDTGELGISVKDGAGEKVNRLVNKISIEFDPAREAYHEEEMFRDEDLGEDFEQRQEEIAERMEDREEEEEEEEEEVDDNLFDFNFYD